MPVIKKYIYVRKKGATFEEVEGKVYILNEKNDTILSLNETATFLWKQLISKLTAEELTGKLTQSYNVSREVASKDVSDFLDYIYKAGLLIRKPL